MKRIVIILLALLGSLLLGCLDAGETITTGTQDFSVVLTSNKKCPRAGETMRLKATVTNESSQTKVIDLNDRPVFDVIIGNQNKGGTRWSDDKPLTPELTRLELAPGESKSIEMDWVSTGFTSVAAIFITDAQSVDHPLLTGFVIPPYCPGIGP